MKVLLLLYYQYSTNDYIKDGAKAACWAIRNLASATAFNYSLLAATKVCEATMFIANKYTNSSDSNDMKEEIAWLIATLSCDKELSERLGSLEACPLILRLLVEKLEILDLVADSTYVEALSSVLLLLLPLIRMILIIFIFLQAIRNLCSNSNSNQLLLGNQGGVEILTSLLAKYVDDVSSSTNGINESKYEIDVEAKCKEDAIDYCVGALFNMMFDCEDNKNRIANNNTTTTTLILLVTKIFSIYVNSLKSSRNVIETLMRMMISITTNHLVNRQALITADSNILSLVVKAMRRYPKDDDIVRTACEVFIHVHYYTQEQRNELIEKQLLDDQIRVVKLINNDDDTNNDTNDNTIEKVITLWNLDSITHT